MRRTLEIAIGVAAVSRAVVAAWGSDVATTLVWAVVAIGWSAFAFLRTEPQLEEARARAPRR